MPARLNVALVGAELMGSFHAETLAHFVECARTGSAPAVTGKDGRESLRMALAAIESARTGHTVVLAVSAV